MTLSISKPVTVIDPPLEARCPSCNKLLFKILVLASPAIGAILLEIVCQRCGQLVQWPSITAVRVISVKPRQPVIVASDT